MVILLVVSVIVNYIMFIHCIELEAKLGDAKKYYGKALHELRKKEVEKDEDK